MDKMALRWLLTQRILHGGDKPKDSVNKLPKPAKNHPKGQPRDMRFFLSHKLLGTSERGDGEEAACSPATLSMEQEAEGGAVSPAQTPVQQLHDADEVEDTSEQPTLAVILQGATMSALLASQRQWGAETRWPLWSSGWWTYLIRKHLHLYMRWRGLIWSLSDLSNLAAPLHYAGMPVKLQR